MNLAKVFNDDINEKENFCRKQHGKAERVVFLKLGLEEYIFLLNIIYNIVKISIIVYFIKIKWSFSSLLL